LEKEKYAKVEDKKSKGKGQQSKTLKEKRPKNSKDQEYCNNA